MGRRVEASQVGDDDWYVPDVEDNRDQAEKDPDNAFKVRIAPATLHELQRIEEDTMAKLSGGKAFKRNVFRRGNLAQERIIAKYVLEVRGYTVLGKSGTLHAPSDGAGLLAAVSDGPASEVTVLDDILEAIRDSSKMREGLAPKSASPSGSPAQAIGASSGDARSVVGATGATAISSVEPATATP